MNKLLFELGKLGPLVAADLLLKGNTRDCQTSASQVANYLYEKGFAVNTDFGAGKYASHFDIAVATPDGWVSVDRS